MPFPALFSLFFRDIGHEEKDKHHGHETGPIGRRTKGRKSG
jgi:hypothetical protein